MLDIIAFLALLLLLAGAGWRRASSAASFTVASRDLSLFPLVATLVMTEFNTSTLLAFAAAGYGAGPMALALPAVFLVGLLFYTVTVARAWKRFDRLSVAELFTVRYSKGVGRTASLLLLLAMTGFTATYVKSLALLFTPLAPAWLPVPALSGLLSIVVLLSVLPGGLVSIVRADVVAFLATIVLLPLLLVLGMKQSALSGGLASVFPSSQLALNPIAQWNSTALPMRFVSTLMVITCFWGIVSVVSSLALVGPYGITGVAAITAAGMALQSITALLWTKHVTGMWTHIGSTDLFKFASRWAKEKA